VTEKHVFDDLDALRRAGDGHERPRKPRAKKSPSKTKGDCYVQMTEQQAVKGFTAVRCQQALVWYAILYLVWKQKSRTVVLPNQWLVTMGVSRWTKNRALARFVKAKLIRVVRFGKKSPRITLV
jgi:hypothetical protein